MELLKDIKLFVLDLDGTFYLGDRLFPFSLNFIRRVEMAGLSFLFFTNNSSRSPKEYISRLTSMGCPITREQIMTSGDVMVRYLNENHNGATIYCLGTPALCESFCAAGINLINADAAVCDDPKSLRPDVVVAGFDRTLSFESLSLACHYIRNGACFLATHPDINCPVEGGFEPDCGAICAAISLSCGVTPTVLGKPSPLTAKLICGATGFAPHEVAFVGDRLYTDVAAGVNSGCSGFLVLSGEATIDDLETSDVRPTAVFKDLGEIAELLSQL